MLPLPHSCSLQLHILAFRHGPEMLKLHFALFSSFLGSHFGHLPCCRHYCVFGRVGIAGYKGEILQTVKKTQMVKYVVDQKVLFIFFLNKRKSQAVIWFSACAYLNGHRTGVSSALQLTVCECLWEAVCVLCVALLLTVWNLCAWVCVCAVVTGQWCACSDCILWPSALNK